MKFSCLYIIFFFLTNLLKSDELKIYNIGFLDIKEDMRYSKWGIHPVDIRSKLNKEKRPIQGALLAIEDSEKFTRLTKTKFLIEHVTRKNYEEAIKFLNSKRVEKPGGNKSIDQICPTCYKFGHALEIEQEKTTKLTKYDFI